MDFCLIKEFFKYTATILNKQYRIGFVRSASFRRYLEWGSVAANLLFTVFYLNKSVWAFPLGIIGPLMLLLLSWGEKLYAEPVLQLVYMASAIVGWYNARDGWSEVYFSNFTYAFLFVGSIALALLWGYTLKRFTSANLPYMDSLMSTWGVVGTWLMMYQVHACWLYLIGVNVLSVYIYFRRGLYAATGMFILYLAMALDGFYHLKWFTW
jgi:nicotinamide mononucleotide transporter